MNVITGYTESPKREPLFLGLLVLLGAAIIAAVSARNYAGGWNDGSRFATVEALVDYHTLAIDESIFVKPEERINPQGPLPYLTPDLLKEGTRDKLFIAGHFYSDKPMVISFLMAGLYQVWQWVTGLTAQERPDLFCLVLTLGTSGLAYVIAVWCIYHLAGRLGLDLGIRLALTVSFALATVALPYTRHINNHIVFLGVAAALFLGLCRLAKPAQAGKSPWLHFTWLGTLGGLAYTLDLATGPVLLLCLSGFLVYHMPRWQPLLAYCLGVLPWFVAHHAINYAIGGTWQPANAVPEYTAWHGSPFTSANLTGDWKHSLGHLFVYGLAMLFGKHGFIGHNLPLFLAIPGVIFLLRPRHFESGLIIFSLCWPAGTWLLYTALSNNYSGQCCSIRWFVPLLVPGYFLLAVFLREFPNYRWDFYVLTGWGIILGTIMWWYGPWIRHMVPFFWPIQGAALLSWLACRHWRRRAEQRSETSMTPQRQQAARAA